MLNLAPKRLPTNERQMKKILHIINVSELKHVLKENNHNKTLNTCQTHGTSPRILIYGYPFKVLSQLV